MSETIKTAMTVAEAARRLSLTNWETYQMCVRGELPARKVGQRRYAVDADAVAGILRDRSPEERRRFPNQHALERLTLPQIDAVAGVIGMDPTDLTLRIAEAIA